MEAEINQLRQEKDNLFKALEAYRAALAKRAIDAETDNDRLRGLLREAQGALGNLVNLHGHASVVLRKHPAPCNGLDFCVMRDADVIKGHIDSYFNPAPESQAGGAPVPLPHSSAGLPSSEEAQETGFRGTTSTSQACPSCRGRGHFGPPCDDCNGTGRKE